jgi:hypothetical protein
LEYGSHSTTSRVTPAGQGIAFFKMMKARAGGGTLYRVDSRFA